MLNELQVCWTGAALSRALLFEIRSVINESDTEFQLNIMLNMKKSQ